MARKTTRPSVITAEWVRASEQATYVCDNCGTKVLGGRPRRCPKCKANMKNGIV